MEEDGRMTKALSVRMDYETLQLTTVHKVIGLTNLFGKWYCWMDDRNGTIYLQPVTLEDECLAPRMT